MEKWNENYGLRQVPESRAMSGRGDGTAGAGCMTAVRAGGMKEPTQGEREAACGAAEANRMRGAAVQTERAGAGRVPGGAASEAERAGVAAMRAAARAASGSADGGAAAEKPLKSIEIGPAIYRALAGRLREAIGGREYIGSVRIELEQGEVDCTLLVSAMVYYQRMEAADGAWNRMTDIVPVWWELHSYQGEGCGEVLNDFSFSELKPYLLG